MVALAMAFCCSWSRARGLGWVVGSVALVLSSCGGGDHSPSDEMDNEGGSASGGDEPSGDGDDSSGAESGGHSSGGNGSGGKGPGSGGAVPSSGGDEGLGGAEGGTTGEEPEVDPGDLLFDLPVREAGLPSGYVLTLDLNGDGLRDATWVDPWSVSGSTLIHFAVADGLGGYTEVEPITVSGSSTGGTFGDFNADDIPDLFLAGVRAGVGDGTFGDPVAHPGGLLGDFNEDGRDDGLVLRGSNTPNSVLNLTNED